MNVKFDNGVEVEFDILDAKTADVFEEFSRNIAEISSNEMYQERPGDAIRSIFDAVSNGCNKLFGDGMGDKICGTRPNLRVALNVFSKLRESQDKQVKEIEKMSNSVKKKYQLVK